MMENLFDLLVLFAQLSIAIIIVVILFTCIFRPLLKYFSINHEIEHRKKHGDSIPRVDSDSDNISERRHADRALGFTVPNARSAKKEMLNRLAASDPEKAGNLIKKWLNEE